MLAIKFALTVKLLEMHKLKCLKIVYFLKVQRASCVLETPTYMGNVIKIYHKSKIPKGLKICFVLFKRFWGKI